MNDHRALYPEQYAHPLVGKHVHVFEDAEHEGGVIAEGVVARVVDSRFGMLAILEGDTHTAYAVAQVHIITDEETNDA